MTRKIKAAFQTKVGISSECKPWETIEIREIDLPTLKANQVRVRTKMASINPADINYMQGEHPDLRPLPRILGLESIGEIIEVGQDVKDLMVGQHVIPLKELIGFWCEEYVSDADELFVVPTSIPYDQAVLFRLVVTTAWCLLHEIVKLESGDWIIQNAANSSVGKCIIQLAKHFGWKTINIVRRESSIPELKKLGADIVITDEVPVDEKIGEYCKDGSKKLLGLNAVGGSTAARLARCIDMHGYLVTYGAMSGRPLIIENRALIFQDIKFIGFNYDHWINQTDLKKIRAEYEKMVELLQSGVFTFSYEKIYDFADLIEAVKHAANESKGGKILLKFG